jgi:hypothetical protein
MRRNKLERNQVSIRCVFLLFSVSLCGLVAGCVFILCPPLSTDGNRFSGFSVLIRTAVALKIALAMAATGGTQAISPAFDAVRTNAGVAEDEGRFHARHHIYHRHQIIDEGRIHRTAVFVEVRVLAERMEWTTAKLSPQRISRLHIGKKVCLTRPLPSRSSPIVRGLASQFLCVRRGARESGSRQRIRSWSHR